MSLRTLLVLVALLPALALAGASSATKTVGEPGGFSSCGTGHPPTLCDGVTEARARLEFTYFDETSTLAVRVTNISPVIRGVPNPVLTKFWFNVPPLGITNLTQISQFGPAGVIPAWNVQFDPNIFSAPNPVGAPPFGAFNAQMSNPKGFRQAIANAEADTLGIPREEALIGPVTFLFLVSHEPGSSLTASSFVENVSQESQGPNQVNNAGLFVAGGPGLSTGTLSNLPLCVPVAYMVGSPHIGSFIQFVLSGPPGCTGWLVVSTDPGPLVFDVPGQGLLELPVGLPFGVMIPNTTIPRGELVTRTFQIPEEPALVRLFIFGAAVLVDPTGRIGVSPQFRFRLLS